MSDANTVSNIFTCYCFIGAPMEAWLYMAITYSIDNASELVQGKQCRLFLYVGATCGENLCLYSVFLFYVGDLQLLAWGIILWTLA